MRMERTKQRTVVISLLLAIVGILLLIGATEAPWQWLSTTLTNIGSFIFASIILALIFELWQKRLFLEEVFADAQTLEQMRSAGFSGFSFGFHDTTRWNALFNNSKYLRIVFAYASTWRNVYRKNLEEFVKNGGDIRVVLPDYEEPVVLTELAFRFSMEPDELTSRIQEAVSYFESLDALRPGAVRVFLLARPLMFTFYRFDREAVIALYRHPPERSLNVPTFIVKRGGSLYNLLDEEWEKITTKGLTGGYTRQVHPALPPNVE